MHAAEQFLDEGAIDAAIAALDRAYELMLALAGAADPALIEERDALRLLIAAQPTRGIDVGAKFEIYNLIWDLVDEGKGVIVTGAPQGIGEATARAFADVGARVCAVDLREAAVAAMAGAFFILDDPIFSGLAVSLIFGILVSTLLTLVVIPVVYYAYEYRKHGD